MAVRASEPSFRARLHCVVMWLVLSACQGALTVDGELRPFPLHLVVLTAHPSAPTARSQHTDPDDEAVSHSGASVLQREVDILNAYFVTDRGEPVCGPDGCISFRYRQHVFRDDVAQTRCTELLALGDPNNLSRDEYDDLSDRLSAALAACDDPIVRDPTAINVYVYDGCAWSDAQEAPDCTVTTSRGRVNVSEDGHQPAIYLDHARLQHQQQSPEEHEMGHALGLAHNCDPAVTSVDQSSNIMQSHCFTEGQSGGRRDRGFGVVSHDGEHGTWDQVVDLLQTASDIQASWADLQR